MVGFDLNTALAIVMTLGLWLLKLVRGNDIGSTRIELKGEGDRYHKYHGNILDFHMHLKLNNRQRQNIPTSLGSLMATQKSLRGLGSDA
ncbi:hypothetical protein V6N13_064186 [Hibiscus sabdariffa]|uniref:Uncharacterized protein n=1 Tax=Hibiscus sabdariffa TaxID=183260 RepID=A0ABR2ASS8_9ROSI